MQLNNKKVLTLFFFICSSTAVHCHTRLQLEISLKKKEACYKNKINNSHKILTNILHLNLISANQTQDLISIDCQKLVISQIKSDKKTQISLNLNLNKEFNNYIQNELSILTINGLSEQIFFKSKMRRDQFLDEYHRFRNYCYEYSMIKKSLSKNQIDNEIHKRSRLDFSPHYQKNDFDKLFQSGQDIMIHSLEQFEYPLDHGNKLLRILQNKKTISHLDRLTKTPQSRNNVVYLHQGKSSREARFKLLKLAKNNIYLTVPYWHSDYEGQLFLYALSKKIGLDIRYILDSSSNISVGDPWGKRIFKHLEQITHHQTIIWNDPKWLETWSINLIKNHIHEKLFIVDSQYVLLGGMNIGDHYLASGKNGWHDDDVLIYGPAAQWASEYFIKIYEISKYIQHPLRKLPLNKKKRSTLLNKIFYQFPPLNNISDSFNLNDSFWTRNGLGNFKKLYLNIYEQIMANRSLMKRNFTFNQYKNEKQIVRLIIDNPLIDQFPKKEKSLHRQQHSKLLDTLEFLLSRANQEVFLTIPYMTLTTRLKKLLIAHSNRLNIYILTNSLDSLDIGGPIYNVAINHYHALLKAGIRIFEWNGNKEYYKIQKKYNCIIPEQDWPGATLHSKLIVIDGVVSFVGSHNLNTRSEKYNSESMAMITGKSFAKKVLHTFMDDLEFYQRSSIPKISCGSLKLERPMKSRKVDLSHYYNFFKGHKGLLKKYYSLWAVKYLSKFM